MNKLAMLKQKRESIIQQRDNAFAVHQQAIGALTLIDHLIELENKDQNGLTLDELASTLGADSAEIVEANSNNLQ